MSSDINESKSYNYKSVLTDKTDVNDFEEIKYKDKIKVECICPKCGIKHKMNLHWIGRGTPRKFCQTCKGSN